MQLVVTGDGSHTLYVPTINEHYHSTYGALTESRHVFIHAGLEYLRDRKQVSVFEVGFGTGLNALLTCTAAIEGKINMMYYAIENNPVDVAVACRLNYANMLAPHLHPEITYRALHQAPWDTTSFVHPCFQLHKIHDSLIDFIPDFSYDLIYFDAFSPEKQPELWTAEIFKKLYQKLNPGGLITTYCVKGSVKRILKETGFKVEKLPGPPGKREILRGVKLA
jgi:tRNA U34 5-methylaminomethyl-2-thiouridine-forming methyltransferase MnmC